LTLEFTSMMKTVPLSLGKTYKSSRYS